VTIKVLQGEREMASDNKLLGEFNLSGIPPAPRGVPQIQVTFDIDVNGIVHVSAKDKGTGREQNITIQSSGGLSDAEIDRMLREAEQYSEADKKKKDLVEVRNHADTAIYSIEKSLHEHSSQIPQSEKDSIQEAINALKDALETDDADDIKSKTQDLNNAAQKIGQIIYQNRSSEGGDDQGKDAEYEDKPKN
jgi:molecular chaperone DnaK